MSQQSLVDKAFQVSKAIPYAACSKNGCSAGQNKFPTRDYVMRNRSKRAKASHTNSSANITTSLPSDSDKENPSQKPHHACTQHSTIPISDCTSMLTGYLNAVTQDLPHEAKARQSAEAEPPNSTMDPSTHWQYHSVRAYSFNSFCPLVEMAIIQSDVTAAYL